MCSLKNVGAALFPSKLLLQSLSMDLGATVTQGCGGHAVHPGLGAMGGLSTLIRIGHHLIPQHQR